MDRVIHGTSLEQLDTIPEENQLKGYILPEPYKKKYIQPQETSYENILYEPMNEQFKMSNNERSNTEYIIFLVIVLFLIIFTIEYRSIIREKTLNIPIGVV